MESRVGDHPALGRVEDLLAGAPALIVIAAPHLDPEDLEFQFVHPERIHDAQIGYAYTDRGETLITTARGSWQATWLVVAHDALCGDPVFVDLDDANLALLTAAHGEGSWDPLPLYPSLVELLSPDEAP